MSDCVKRSKTELKPHQRRVVEYMDKHRAMILSHSVGSGKTLTMCTASQCYLDKNPGAFVIFISPKSLIDNFKKELEITYGASTDRYEFYTFAGSLKLSVGDKKFMLIVDEAHNLRTEITYNKDDIPTDGKIVDHIMRISYKADKIILSSGTPIYNKTYDLANLISIVRGIPRITEQKFDKIKLETLSKYFDFYTNREHYPNYKEHYINIKMSANYYKEYKKIEERRSELFGAKNPFAFLSIVRQSTNVIYECPKCNWIVNKVSEKPYSRNIVFSSFINKGTDQVKERLEDKKISYAEITGELTQKERKRAVELYNSGNIQVLLITKAGGEGLDLKETDNIIIMELPWNFQALYQIIGRGVRYKSHSDPKAVVNIYYLILEKPKVEKIPSADVILFDLIKRKQKYIERSYRLLKQ